MSAPSRDASSTTNEIVGRRASDHTTTKVVKNLTQSGRRNLHHAQEAAEQFVRAHSSLRNESKHQPFEVAKDREAWGAARNICAKVVEHEWFDSLMGFIVVGNVLIMFQEADMGAECYDGSGKDRSECESLPIFVVNIILVVVYTVELLMRLAVYQRKFFSSLFNLIDVFVVVTGIVELAFSGLPSVQMLRLFRVVRLVRAIRILRTFKELYAMVRGFASAMWAMFWGFVLILVLLAMWSIMAVEVIHPLNMELVKKGTVEDPYCMAAYSTVYHATLQFFQTLVAGDAWGECSMDLIQEYPGVFVIFAGALTTVQLGFTNLILAVIVETAQEARDKDKELQRMAEAKFGFQLLTKLLQILTAMDADDSGLITFDELLDAYEADANVREILHSLNVGKGDLRVLFDLLDDEGTGSVSYYDFLEGMQKAQVDDLRTQMMVLRFQNAQMHWKLKREVADSHLQLYNEIKGEIKGEISNAMLPPGLLKRETAASRPTPSNSRKLERLHRTQELDSEPSPFIASSWPRIGGAPAANEYGPPPMKVDDIDVACPDYSSVLTAIDQELVRTRRTLETQLAQLMKEVSARPPYQEDSAQAPSVSRTAKPSNASSSVVFVTRVDDSPVTVRTRKTNEAAFDVPAMSAAGNSFQQELGADETEANSEPRRADNNCCCAPDGRVDVHGQPQGRRTEGADI